MELDDFKPYWKVIQNEEITYPKVSREKLNQMMIETTGTLNQLEQKSTNWIRINNVNTQRFKGLLMIFLLFILVKALLKAKDMQSIETLSVYLSTSLAYITVILIHYYISIWVFERQRRIFTYNNFGNLKQTLKKTIDSFRRFYIQFNIIYLILYPAYFYSVIKLITVWTPSTTVLLLTCAALTLITLLISHILYIIQYRDKINVLRANLHELAEDI